ncbi:MAG: hypothetical protein IJK46_14805 [Prevotella sp.]|nr:hypothetical protein [Prevotella sp.]
MVAKRASAISYGAKIQKYFQTASIFHEEIWDEKGRKGEKRDEKGGKGRKRDEKGGKGRKRDEKGHLEPLDKGRLSLGDVGDAERSGERMQGFNPLTLTPLVAQSIRPFSPLLIPFLPYKPF